VDCFKKVNDTYGHLIGDQVLVKITESIKQSIRLSDVLARWGGEEFVILLPHTTQEDAGIVAEKIRRGIETTLFESVGKMTISCGVSQVQIGDDRSTFFQRVDSALYQAKKRGRNCIVHN
jgi:diguanylate cyclase (GGDEF)-like protein